MISNYKNKNPLLALWCFLLGAYLVFNASTCEEPIDLEVEAPVQLVAICEFTPDDLFKVFVSESKSILDRGDREAIYRKDAIVKLSIGGQTPELLELKEDVSGAAPYFQSTFLPNVNQTYNLNIDAPGLPSIMATDDIPTGVAFESNLQSVEIKQNAGNSLTYTLDLVFNWEDEANTENYYHLNIYRPITFFWVVDGDTTTNLINPLGAEFFSESLNPDGSFVVNFNGGALIKDDAFDGQEANINVKYEFQLDASEELFEVIYIELRTVSKTYFEFHNGVSQQQGTGRVTPLSEPIIVPSNIEGGLGLFAGYSSSRDTLRRK